MLSSSLIGHKLGQYDVVAMLGRGGMATVYKGYQPTLDRYVAIKVLPPHPGMDAQFIERFQLEARTIGSLQNPNVLPLYDFGMEGDILYLVMAYVSGGTLADHLEGPLELRQIETWLRGIASGLDYAHRRGVVHRDIKPANILIDSDGHPLLADFGVVKMLTGGSTLTGTSLVGTPAYMSPEQGQGLEVDGRSDVYSLGVMVWEMLTGKHPFHADTPMQTILKHITEPVPDVLQANPNLPLPLGDVMAKVLEKDPRERYVTAIAFAEDFTNAIHNNTDSMIAARRNTPLHNPQSTMMMPPPSGRDSGSEPVLAASANFTNPLNQTVVIRERNNPYVILGGFGVVALAIIGVAILIVSQLNANVPQIKDLYTLVSTEVPLSEIISGDISLSMLPENYRGLLQYNTAQFPGDSVNIYLEDVRQPNEGKRYGVWLVNSDANTTLGLGDLAVFGTGDASFSYVNPDASADVSTALPARFDTLLITQEDSDTTPSAPSADIAFSGGVSNETMRAFTRILATDSDGIDSKGLLESAIFEAEIGAQHAGLGARANTVPGQRTHGEHTVNIYQGTTEDLTGDGDGQNPGRRKGVFRYLDAMDGLTNALLTTPDLQPETLTHAEGIRICTQNVRDWVEQIVALEREIIASDTVESVQPQLSESTQLAEFVLNGADANQNGIVEPFESECGLAQIRDYATQLANIMVFEGDLNAAQ